MHWARYTHLEIGNSYWLQARPVVNEALRSIPLPHLTLTAFAALSR